LRIKDLLDPILNSSS